MIKCCSGCALSAYNGWRLEGLLIKSLVTEALSFNINLRLSKCRRTEGEFPRMDRDCLQMDFNLLHYLSPSHKPNGYRVIAGDHLT